MISKRLARCLVFSAIALLACGDEDLGFPPNITNLSFQPTTATVGQTVTITGSLDFTDPEGDLDRFEAAIGGPGGATRTDPVSLAQYRGQTAGTVQFQLLVLAPVAGSYELQVWLRDEPGNRSNILRDTLEVN